MDANEDPITSKEMLLDIIAGTDELIVETRNSRLEIARTEQEAEASRDSSATSDFGYVLQREQIRRAYENIEFMLRRLERQKKIAIQKLHELE